METIYTKLCNINDSLEEWIESYDNLPTPNTTKLSDDIYDARRWANIDCEELLVMNYYEKIKDLYEILKSHWEEISYEYNEINHPYYTNLPETHKILQEYCNNISCLWTELIKIINENKTSKWIKYEDESEQSRKRKVHNFVLNLLQKNENK